MRYIALLLLTGSLTACVPAPYGPYYRPSYPDSSATLIKKFCRGEAGPPSILTFTIANGVNFTVTTAKSYSERARKDIPLTITMNVPSNVTVQFLSDDLRISDTQSSEGNKVAPSFKVGALLPMINSKDVVDIDRIGPVTSRVVQKFIQTHPGSKVSEAHVDFSLGNEKFHPEIISLQLPSVHTNGTAIAIPPLQLIANTQDKGWWKYETREHRQAREKKYARCLEETPHLHCENILQILDEGYDFDATEFEMTGRLFMAGYTRNPKLSGHLSLVINNVAPWQFTTNEIRGEDIKTAEVQHYYFDQFSVFFGWYDVPFTTVVKGLQSGTTIRIESSLGEQSRSKYYIKLPPLLINGHEYVLKPIELDLKMFDGGIEPFNC